MSSIKLKVLNDIKSKITIQRDKLKAFYDRDVFGEIIQLYEESSKLEFTESNTAIIQNIFKNIKRLEALHKSHSQNKKTKVLLEIHDMDDYLKYLEREIYYCK